MDADIGESLVRWTARLAVAAYVVRLFADVERGNPVCRASIDTATTDGDNAGDDGIPAVGKPGFFGERTVLWVWTLGCGIYLLHVTAAFHFIHGWSHTAAYEHTARQTAAVTGWQWGGGLWINYAFTLWWPLDVVWSWRRGLDGLPRRYVITLHAVVGFLMFNATVVFGPTWWRWVAVPVLGTVIWLLSDRRPET